MLKQLFLISQFECKRFFATRRGLLGLTTFAVVWLIILLYPLRFAAKVIAEDRSLATHFSFFDFIGLRSINNWVVPEFAVYWHFALFLFPLLSISLAADQTSSDRERGTLRFLLIRSTRDNLFFGRFMGVVLVQILLIAAASLSTLFVAITRDVSLFKPALAAFSVVMVNLCLASLPFTALMAVLSAVVKVPRQATLWAIFIWTFLAGIMSLISYYLQGVASLKFLVPGYQLSALSQLSGWQTLTLSHIPLLQSLVLLAIGRWVIGRQAL